LVHYLPHFLGTNPEKMRVFHNIKSQLPPELDPPKEPKPLRQPGEPLTEPPTEPTPVRRPEEPGTFPQQPEPSPGYPPTRQPPETDPSRQR
jgi:hypothetical protein